MMTYEAKSRRIKTTRRYDAESRISLRKLRKWFDDDGTGTESQPETESPESETETESPSTDSTPISELPAGTQEEIKQLRDQAKRYRLKAKSLEAKEAERLRAEQIEKGQFEEVIAELQPKADAYDLHIQETRESNEIRIDLIPELWKPMVESVASRFEPLELGRWLDENASNFTRPPLPNLDAGAMGDKKPPSVKLTNMQKQMARNFNMTDEEYINKMNME